jgi:hypothetical protein
VFTEEHEFRAFVLMIDKIFPALAMTFFLVFALSRQKKLIKVP